MEQQPLYDSIVQDQRGLGQPIGSMVVPGFLCPSDDGFRVDPQCDQGISVTHYVASEG